MRTFVEAIDCLAVMLSRQLVALSRYQEIIDNPESGEIDYESVDPGTTKPTKAAIRVNDLLETVTGMIHAMITIKRHANLIL